MSEEDEPSSTGRVLWQDLTVEDAVGVRDFYREVAGWESEPVDMGGYDDFNMIAPGSGETVAGICHARGANADLPAQWLLYVGVDDLRASIERCRDLGGEVVSGPRRVEDDRYCVIRDPAGAIVALYESGA